MKDICSECVGAGVVQMDYEGNYYASPYPSCTLCDGTGMVEEDACINCGRSLPHTMEQCRKAIRSRGQLL